MLSNAIQLNHYNRKQVKKKPLLFQYFSIK